MKHPNFNNGKALAIFRSFFDKAMVIIRNPERLKNLLDQVTHMLVASGRKLGDVYDDVKTMGRLVRAFASGEYRDVNIATVVYLVAALLYLVSPLDAIPDVIPVLGLTDDLFILSLVIGQLADELEAFRAWEESGGADPSLA